MIYNNGNSLQRQFVTGRYTLTLLLGGAALLWLAGVMGEIAFGSVGPRSFWSGFLPLWIEEALAFGVYVAAALLLNSFVIIEGRTPWLGGLFVWLAACCLTLHGNLTLALSVLVLLLLVAVLTACHPRENVQRWVYATFALFATAALWVPQFVCLLPLCLLFMSMTGVMNVRNVFAALLGLLTPLWMLFAVIVIVPELSFLGQAPADRLDGLLLFSFAVPRPDILLPMAIEAVVTLWAAALFSRSPSPAKPLMRRVLSLFIYMNIYLWLLSWLLSDCALVFFVWRLPGVALFVAYIFSLRFTRLYNICFWILALMSIVVVLFNVWLWIF